MKWVWSTECEQAAKLNLACDASPYGEAAVISHEMDDGKDRPIAFASRTLTNSERNYTQVGGYRNHCMVAISICMQIINP